MLKIVITGAVADAEAAVAGQPGELGEAFWVLDVGDKEMSADQPDAGDGNGPCGRWRGAQSSRRSPAVPNADRGCSCTSEFGR